MLKAYRWFKANQLSVVWPHPPAALIRGLEVYDAAVNAVQATDIRDERERREKERQQQLSKRAAEKRGRR